MPLLLHPHFHRRRTGVTRHVEDMVRQMESVQTTRALGFALEPSVPRIGMAEVWRRLRTGESIVWHAHRNNELLVGLALQALSRRVALVFTRHSGTPPGRYTVWLAQHAQRRVTLTGVGARHLGLPSTIVPHGVDLVRFQPPADRFDAWRALGLGGTYGIGVVGRIRPDKGQGDFVEAIGPLLPAHPAWRAALVGLVKGPERTWAQGLVRATGGALALTGERHEVAAWYQGLSVVVQPSHAEAFSLVLVEAMASGCCVVASALEQHPEVIEHGRTGFLYPTGDGQALREILARLMADPAKVAEIGRHAREEALARFGIQREVDALLALYRDVLGE